MKKAFDANVSRAKPRVRLGAMIGAGEAAVSDSVSLAAVEAIAAQVARDENADLTAAVRARQFAHTSRVTATEALQQALDGPTGKAQVDEPGEGAELVERVIVDFDTAVPAQSRFEVASMRNEVDLDDVLTAGSSGAAQKSGDVASAPRAIPSRVRNHAEAPSTVTEVQAPSAPTEAEPAERRERLRERLRAVRENPRPEPLPETVAEAGVLAVERISALQSELTKSRAMNLALAQDLEAARRQAERATEEARLRMDEARRLSSEMEGRVRLLSDLERELESLESERNEALLALQESRQALDAGATDKASLQNELLKRETDLNESLAEEERLASELESAQEAMSGLRRAADALKGERDTLARQVSDLTRERAELLEARKALEAVHRALSQAALR